MKKIHLWSVSKTDDGQLRPMGLEELHSAETESRLEGLLVSSPDLLLEGLTLVGRQLPNEGGTLDLLGGDQDGRLVVFELKRGALTRDAVAQILDYASDLANSDTEQLARLIEENSGRNGIEPIEDFADWYDSRTPIGRRFRQRSPTGRGTMTRTI